MVIAVAYTLRMFIDGCGELVEPAPDEWRRRDLEVVTKKPELEACQFPSQACATQRWVPRRKVGRLDFCKPGQRGDEPKTDLSPDARGGASSRALSASSGPKSSSTAHPSPRSWSRRVGTRKPFVGTPRADLEVPNHLISNALWVIGEHRGPVMTIPEPRVASKRGVAGQILPANPGFREDRRLCP